MSWDELVKRTSVHESEVLNGDFAVKLLVTFLVIFHDIISYGYIIFVQVFEFCRRSSI